MANCKACGRWFASTNPADEICYPCNQALKRLNGYAVPVVRCKDCISHGLNGMCALLDVIMAGNDFCSYGERRNEDGSN